MTVLTAVVDPDGRRVELTVERWEHIVRTHAELGSHQQAVLRAVRQPDRRLPGRKPNEEWFYAAGAGPSEWLKVVVAYAQGRGWITTAFARRSFP